MLILCRYCVDTVYSAALPRQFCKRPLPSVTTGLCWAGGRARHPPSSAVSRSFATKSSLASAAAAVARLGKLQRPGPGWPVAYIAPVWGMLAAGGGDQGLHHGQAGLQVPGLQPGGGAGHPVYCGSWRPLLSPGPGPDK